MTAALLSGAMVLAVAAAARAAVAARHRARVARRLPTADIPGPALRRWWRAVAWAPPRRLVDAFDRGAVTLPPADVWPAWPLGTVVLALAALAVAGPGTAVAVGGALAVGPVAALAWVGDRRDRLVEAALPEALEAVARSLRTGASLRSAVAEASAATPAPLGPQLARVAREAGAGTPLPDALDDWAARSSLPGVHLAVAALALGAETGGARARAVDGVAETVRSRCALAGEVRALSAQARLSGLVIALAPVAFAVLAAGVDGGTAAFLLGSPLGLACLALGLALDGLAAWWMARLARVEP